MSYFVRCNLFCEINWNLTHELLVVFVGEPLCGLPRAGTEARPYNAHCKTYGYIVGCGDFDAPQNRAYGTSETAVPYNFITVR